MLLIPIISIVVAIIIIGGLKSRRNPDIDWRIERYIISHKYALPSTTPILALAYYSRLENKIVIFISSIATVIWKRVLRESAKVDEPIEEYFKRKFIEEINVALIHEFAEWGIHQLHPKRLLSHGLWNQYIRNIIT
ncbi:MAG: hypothetical protein NZ929_01345 [Aigarchaeota archaeon]|nr:hypothetical protein [Aigarchaeota archaeon]MCX8193041.1 hypothetical protein [Nitrososphaeria archaeon]MDW7986221.1 hypothetical protein [Nitrososphaerota archaeon]